jgi:hypothetical protein
MFYLKSFFRIYLNQGIKGYLFILFTLAISISLPSRLKLDETIKTLSLNSYLSPYMTVFFDPGYLPKNLGERIRLLGYVKEIQPISVKEGMSSWWQTIKDLKLNGQWGVEPLEGIRIIFNGQIDQIKKNEIHEVLDFKVGNDHLTASDIKYPTGEKFLKTHPFFQSIQQYKSWTFIVPILLIWIILFVLTNKKMSAEIYLMQRYQRKKMLKPKILAFGFSLFVFLGAGLSFAFNSFDLYDLGLSAFFFLIFWSLAFKPVEWKWL